MLILMTKTVHGYPVSWANNGRIYFSRALHDFLPERMQGKSYQCNTIREFNQLCVNLGGKEP